MRKSILEKSSLHFGVDIYEHGNPTPDPEVDVQSSVYDEVIKSIFEVDPVSGLPKGDIQYYLSSDGNPVVKHWLESNLLVSRRSDGYSPKVFSDDLIAEFSRSNDESIDAYSKRLMSMYDEALEYSKHNE